jgi:enoyl-CoA hydratase/carnithine racemase
MSEPLLSERRDEALLLRLNRPDRRNALSLELVDALEAALKDAARDEGLRAVVLTGEGGKAFCSGMDLTVLQGHLKSKPSGAAIRSLQRGLQDAFTRLEELEKPTVAAIEGSCVGGGLELALACDFRFAAQDARLGFPEVRIGMLPDLGGTTRLARVVGPAIAKEWVMTGRLYGADVAAKLGLLNAVTPPGGALDAAFALVKELELCGPKALAWSKRVIDRGFGLSLREGLELEQDAMSELLPDDELAEGVAAFLEKRPPRFRR